MNSLNLIATLIQLLYNQMIQLFRNVKNVTKLPSLQTLDIKYHRQFKKHSNFFSITIESITTLSLNTSKMKKINYQPAYSFSFLIVKQEEQNTQNDGQQKIKLPSKIQTFTNFINFYRRNKQQYSLQQKCQIFRVGLYKFRQKNKPGISNHKQMMLLQIEQFLKELDAEVKKIPFNALLVDHRVKIKQNIYNILTVLLFQQNILLINENQNLKSLITKDRLAKVLLQNFSISQFEERFRFLVYFLKFHKDKHQYLQKLKQKIMLVKSMSFKNQKIQKLILYFYNTNVQLMNLLNTPFEILFSEQIIQQYIKKIESKMFNINLGYLNKFFISVRAYNVNIDKKKLIQFYNLHEKQLNKNINKIIFEEHLKFIKFMSQTINKIDEPDQLDIKIRQKAIKFLQFFNELEIEKQQFIIKQNFHHFLIIMSKINYFNHDIWKKIQVSLFKNIKNTPMSLIEKHVEARINFYEQVKKQKSFLFLQQNQKMTFKFFFQKLFAHLLNQRLLMLQNMTKLLKICSVPLNSEFIEKIHRYVLKMEKKQSLINQNQKKLQ